VAGVGDVGLPEWLALAAPPAAYLAVTFTAWRRTPLPARLKWAALTYAVYLTLGVALAAVFASMRPVGLADALALVFWDFVPALLILTLAAPLILPRPRTVTRWLRARDSIAARRETRLVPPPLVVVGGPATFSFPSEEAFARATPAQLAFTPSSGAAAAAGDEADGAAPAPDETPSADGEPVPEAERVDQGPIGSDPVEVDGEMPIRIPFARVAAQLPADAFVLPPERLAASLRDPGYLVIPLRLILPQLAEGSVEIAWALVDAQFPELGFAEELPEFGERFPKLSLTLPIDEIVRQLPPEIFRVAAPAIDLHAVESFPPPFQPFVTTMEPGASVAAELARFLEHSRADASLQTNASAGAGAASSLSTAFAREAPSAPAIPDDAPPAEADEPETRVENADELEAARVAARRIAACLAPAGSFEVAARRVGARLVLTFVTPGLDVDAVLRTVERVAPLALSEGAELATLRASRATLLVSGSRVAAEDALVVAAVRPGAPLALLEILVARATADARAVDAAGAGEGSGANAVLSEEPSPADAAWVARLRAADAEATRRLASVGGGPAGFGGVAPAAFVDGASGLDVYVFHAHGREPRALGALAGQLHAAMAAGDAGAHGSLTLRQGAWRTVVRPVAGTASRPGVVVASGPVTLAGLAGREVARVAAALEAA
ncbi:MAG: hypothetical protein ACRELS_17180, partial [Candidatus Rokuibacteriota bacterium]